MKKQVMAACVALGLCAAPSFAIVGAGFHWGFDFSTSMTDTKQESILTAGEVDLKKVMPDGVTFPDNFKDSSFLFISRANFERTPINFGGKVFVDALPVEFEVSVNMGIWQYEGAINYIDTFSVEGSDATLSYAKEIIGIEKLGAPSFFGVKNTPYGKFQTDFTVKKTFKKIPLIKPSLGAGASAHFATPVISESLVKSALGITDDAMAFNVSDLENVDNMKKILDAITDGAKKPKVGMHIVAGIQVKPPVIPLGIYVDGKYMIMFDDIESGVGVSTKGFLVNAGIMFKI